jgi:cytoskeleton protein RodZ
MADAVKVGAGEMEWPAAGTAPDIETVPAEDTMILASASVRVGRRLHIAREAAHLSVHEVADSIKFSPRQIEFLEAGDHAALPGNTIVRGFVRGYARLLKLDGDELLQMLDTDLPNAPAEVRPPDNMGIASTPGERRFSPLISVTIVLALAALLIALWHFFVPVTTESVVAVGSRLWSAPQSLLSFAPPSLPAGSPPAGPVQESGAAAPPVAVPAVPVSAEVISSVDTTVQSGPAVTAGATLQFVFHGRSWVEVSDVSRQKLHSAESPPGSRLTLTGRPPFDIVIGNASKVSLTYEERTIDLAPHTRAEVARLTLE